MKKMLQTAVRVGDAELTAMTGKTQEGFWRGCDAAFLETLAAHHQYRLLEAGEPVSEGDGQDAKFADVLFIRIGEGLKEIIT